MLLDIATEELSHLEVIGTHRRHAQQGRQGQDGRRGRQEAELLREVIQGGESHLTPLLLRAVAPRWSTRRGVPWTAAYIDTIGEPTADLRSNIAAEARAKIIYERLMNVTGRPGRQGSARLPDDARGRAPEVVREGAVRDRAELPAGKLPGDPRVHRQVLQHVAGRGRRARPVEQRRRSGSTSPTASEQGAVDGGDGTAAVAGLTKREAQLLKLAGARTMSSPEIDPTTGADLGAKPGAGATKKKRTDGR